MCFMPTLEIYVKMLERHDWTYEMSDDHSVWQRGVEAEGKLLGIAKCGGEPFKKAYNTEYAKQFHRPPFVGPYKFPFPEVV